jgi:methylglyoxal synthase
MIVDARKDLGEDVGLEAGGIQQIVLEKAAGLIGFIIYLCRQLAVGPVCQSDKPVLQRLGQVNDIPTAGNRCPVLRG